MEYTQSQKEAISEFIVKIGITVNEKGCEVWNSTERQRAPYFKLPIENGTTQYVNIRTYIWMEAGGAFVKDTHSSCGTTNCIKLEHIAPGRKKNTVSLSKTPPIHTEREVASFLEKIQNGTTLSENGCHIWGGGLLQGKYPFLPYTMSNAQGPNPYRKLYISRFLFLRDHEGYNPSSKTLIKTCKEDRCVNVNHFELVDNKQDIDLKKAWKLLLEKTYAVDDCLVLKTAGPKGYGTTTLGGVKTTSHRASYIINKNEGKPLPNRDEHGNQLVIRHLCYNQPGCINPDHLELGTQSQNSYEDKIASGTALVGEKCPGSKITEDVAQAIKKSLRDSGHPEYMTKKKRAEIFGTTRGIVEAIDHNRSWAHLPDRFGEVISNADHREKSMKRQRLGREKEWSQSDFDSAGEMIKANTIESEEGKGGTFPPGPCWLWTKCIKDGYGYVCFNGRGTRSHQLSLEAEHGRFSRPGEVVRHLCNNPPCARASHLRFGTRKENAIDVQLTGSSKAFRLDAAKVRMIRRSNASSTELAETLGVHKASIVNVRSGKTWSSVL